LCTSEKFILQFKKTNTFRK